ncbi:MAG: hypothetical protein R2751_01570 [Bacteroidales bacterium]
MNALVTVKDPSTDPTSITITNDNTCQGTAKTLTVVGGSLGTGADWYWYSDAGFSVAEGTGASISVDPATSTTYYVRAEGDCNNTAAVNALVTVKDPADPTSISTITNDNTCQGTAKTLTVVGGSLGTGADWYWYSDAAFTVSEGSGASISRPIRLADTTYYVRAEGASGNTAAVNALVTVKILRRGSDQHHHHQRQHLPGHSQDPDGGWWQPGNGRRLVLVLGCRVQRC